MLCSAPCDTQCVVVCLEILLGGGGGFQEALGPMVDEVAPKQWLALLLSPCSHMWLEVDPFWALGSSNMLGGCLGAHQGLGYVVDRDWRGPDVDFFNSQTIN